MATTPALAGGSPLLVVGDTGGVTVIDPSTPLRRLNYFDGKFLRADDFNVEQAYLRQLVGLSNQGLGAGVVYGYDTVQGSGDTVQIGPGLAIDPSGKVLLLQQTVTQSVQALIDASAKLAAAPLDASGKPGGFGDCVEVAAPPPPTVLQTGDLWVIAICAAEALCGQQDVYGIACQDACVSTSDRPYRLDGIVLRAIPLQLVTPLPTSKAVAIDAALYLRSKVAHAWYADEQRRHPDAISRAGLLSGVWCLGAGYDNACCEVPLAVVARSGRTTQFLDAWIVRRERIDAPARRYWQWKMRMRPWDVYLAQILQFQCQLADALGGHSLRPSAAEAAAHRALDEAAQFVAQVRSGLASYRSVTANATLAERPALLSMSLSQVSDLQQRLATVLQTGLTPALPSQRVLIGLGMVELPSGGYLPVVNGSATSVNDQVRALLGEGVDLRFCLTTADYIAHAIEEAQHMDRISLLQGLDDPKARPRVDILVPDGNATTQVVSGSGLYDATLAFSTQATGGLAYKGVAREEALASGGTALYSAQAGLSQVAVVKMQGLARAIVKPGAATRAPNVSGNLYSNAFVKRSAALGSKLDVKVATAATTARRFVSAGQLAAEGADTGIAAGARATSATETIDGLWLTARLDDAPSGLAVNGHTGVHLRAVIATRPATPLAIELGFNGSLTVTSNSTVGGPLVQKGSLNGVLSLGILAEDQARQSTVEYEFTERFNWPATLRHSGQPGSGAVAMDIALDAAKGLSLRITKTVAGNGVQIVYALAIVAPGTGNNGGTESVTPIGQLVMSADAAAADPANAYHRYAESGLALVQAALVVSEPTLKAQAESLLFPAAPAAGPELVIQAVRDWVAFVRRRERRCAPDVPPPPPLPARGYRVIELSYDNLDTLRSVVGRFQLALKDPALLAKLLQELVAVSGRDNIHLVVNYAGGSAAALSDLAEVRADWPSFKPGKAIHYAAIGAVGESDAALQLERLATFKVAIAGLSDEVAGATEDVMLPFPEAGQPDDADGVLLVITLLDAQPVVRNDIVTVGLVSAVGSSQVPYFLPQQPRATVSFQDNVPQGGTLGGFAGALTAGVAYTAVTLWRNGASIDSGAAARAVAVRDAMAQAGRMAATAPTGTQLLTTQRLAELAAAGVVLTGIDDVIAVERLG